MKSAGIITLHFYENFGSVLQCWALKTAVESLGVKAKVINYIPPLNCYEYFTEEHHKKLFKNKKQKFREFCKNKLLITEPIAKEDLNDNDFDSVIAGSDQIWNLDITRSDTAYFLDFVKNEKIKIAYAASMALSCADDKINKNIFKKYIPRFNAISVREKSLVPFIKKFTAHNVERNIARDVVSALDPTLLLSAGDYDKIIEEPENAALLRGEPFLFVYFLTHDSAAVDYALCFAKRFNLRIAHCFAALPSSVFPKDSIDMTFAGPSEFLWCIKNAALVWTNSFHGTALSALFNKNFYTFTAKRKMLSRVLDFTEDTHLEARRLCGFNDFKNAAAQNIFVDYKITNDALDRLRKESFNFLKDALCL